MPGFVATTRFFRGVRLAVNHILAHPELQQPDPEFDAWCDKIVAAIEQAKQQLIG